MSNEIRELTAAELDIVGGGGHHHQDNNTTIVFQPVFQFDNTNIGSNTVGNNNGGLANVSNWLLIRSLGGRTRRPPIFYPNLKPQRSGTLNRSFTGFVFRGV